MEVLNSGAGSPRSLPRGPARPVAGAAQSAYVAAVIFSGDSPELSSYAQFGSF